MSTMPTRTACPTWCQTDHQLKRYGNHTHTLGQAGPVEVTIIAWSHMADEYPAVAVRNSRRPSSSPSEESRTDIELCHAPGFAALMETLGHHEIAGLVREAIELIEDNLKDGDGQ